MAKDHIPNEKDPKKPLCSFNMMAHHFDMDISILPADWESRSIDMEYLCKYCKKRYMILNGTSVIPKPAQQTVTAVHEA